MSRVFLYTIFCAVFLATVKGQIVVEPCDQTICNMPECNCASYDIPKNMKTVDTPQFVLITIEGPISITTFKHYDFFFGKQNPDGCPLSATAIVKASDVMFSYVKRIHDAGLEIALDPWHLDNFYKDYENEYDVQRAFFETMAGVKDIAVFSNGKKYPAYFTDSFYSTMPENGFFYELSNDPKSCHVEGQWPYTLDHNSFFSCPSWPLKESHPGVWVIPPSIWRDLDGQPCTRISDCAIPTYSDLQLNWLLKEFERQSLGNRAPITIRFHTDWFKKISETVFQNFINYLQKIPGIFLVSPPELIHWMQNPRTISEMISNKECFRK